MADHCSSLIQNDLLPRRRRTVVGLSHLLTRNSSTLVKGSRSNNSADIWLNLKVPGTFHSFHHVCQHLPEACEARDVHVSVVNSTL